MICQGIGFLLDINYSPSTPEERQQYKLATAFLFSVLMECVQYSEGRRRVFECRATKSGHQAFHSLVNHFQTSTFAVLACEQLRNKIYGMHLTASYTKSYVEFINTFLDNVESYNEQQQDPDARINDSTLLVQLQHAVSQVPELHNCKVITLQQAAMNPNNGPPTLDQYMHTLSTTAEVLDHTRVMMSRGATRGAHQAEIHEPPDDPLTPGEIEAQSHIMVNETRVKAPADSRLSPSTWDAVGPETKKAWSKIAASDRSLILRDSAPAQRSAHLTEIPSETPSETPDETADAPDAIEANNAISETHPANMRRVLSSSAGKPTDKAAPRAARTVSWHANAHSRSASFEDDKTVGGYDHVSISHNAYLENLIEGCNSVSFNEVCSTSAFHVETTSREDFCPEDNTNGEHHHDHGEVRQALYGSRTSPYEFATQVADMDKENETHDDDGGNDDVPLLGSYGDHGDADAGYWSESSNDWDF